MGSRRLENFHMKKTLGILTGLLLTGSAHAASFQYGNYTVVDEQNIQVLTPNNISGGMGEIILQGAGADINKTLAAWCIDLFDHLQHSATYNITPLTTAGVGAP